MRLLGLALFALIVGASVAADDAEEPASEDTAAQADLEAANPALAEDDLLDEIDAAIDESMIADDANDDDAENATNVRATLEKFVPSEQISEDNSVAYPNDI